MTTETDQGSTGGADSASSNGASAEQAGAPKRVMKRKPLWLAVPKEYVDLVNEQSGEIERSPVSYELYECPDRAMVMQVLKKLGLDARNLDPKDVKIFRGDPLPGEIDMQISLKF